MRKIKRMISLGLCLAIATGCRGTRLGVIKGPEFDYIILGEDVYERVDDSDVSNNDKGEFLGYVTDGGRIKFEVYDVLNDQDEYRYCLWDYEGFIYRIVE